MGYDTLRTLCRLLHRSVVCGWAVAEARDYYVLYQVSLLHSYAAPAQLVNHIDVRNLEGVLKP